MTVHHLVKGEDLNHHHTLYAGRGAEWLVEAGFIAASSLLPAEYVLCLKIHGMVFSRPVSPGEVVKFESRIVLTGRSRLVAYIKATTKDEPLWMVLSPLSTLTMKADPDLMASQLKQRLKRRSRFKNAPACY